MQYIQRTTAGENKKGNKNIKSDLTKKSSVIEEAEAAGSLRVQSKPT